MHSFLMLPMQRITRLPLLVDAIFHRLEHNTPIWHEYKVALATLTKVTQLILSLFNWCFFPPTFGIIQAEVYILSYVSLNKMTLFPSLLLFLPYVKDFKDKE